MKTFFLFSLLASLSFSSFATTPALLKKYQGSRYVIKQQPTGLKGIPNKGVSTVHGTVYTKLYNVCQEAGMIRTINPVKMCAEYGPKPVRCDNGSRGCFDRDEKVCVRYENVQGESPIIGEREVCANYWEARRMGWRGDRDNFDNDYPRCTVFKTISVNTKTSYKFSVADKRLRGSDRDERRYGGKLIDIFNYVIPACN